MRTLAVLVGVVILLAALNAAASVVVPLLLGATIAVIFAPIAERLNERGLPPIAAAVVTLVAVLAVVGGMSALVVMAVADLTESLPRYQAVLESTRQDLIQWLTRRQLDDLAGSVATMDVSDEAGSMVTSTLMSAGSILGDGFLVLLIAVFIQLETALFRRKLHHLLGRGEAVERTLRAVREVQRYLGVKVFLSAANGVLLGAWCWGWGVSNPLLWGVLAFVLNFVPVIGSLIAAVPPVALGLIELGPAGAAGIALGYGLVNLLVDNVLEPRLMGRALGLSPLVLLLSMLIWGFVLGPVGALLSVPLTVAARIFLDYSDETRWIAVLLAAGPRTWERRMAPPIEGSAGRAAAVVSLPEIPGVAEAMAVVEDEAAADGDDDEPDDGGSPEDAPLVERSTD